MTALPLLFVCFARIGSFGVLIIMIEKTVRFTCSDGSTPIVTMIADIEYY